MATIGAELDQLLADLRSRANDANEKADANSADIESAMNDIALIMADIKKIKESLSSRGGSGETPPFRGIQVEYDALEAGVTELRIPSGEYTEELTLNRAGVGIYALDGDVLIRGRVHIAASNVTIGKNVHIEEGTSASPQYWGTVWSDGVDNLVFQGSVARSAWAGIAIKGGSGHVISGSSFFENGALGIRLDSVHKTVVENVASYGNNTDGHDPGWEAGGIKVSGNYGGASTVAVVGGMFYDNDGSGIWFDVDTTNCNISDNTVHHNTRAGVLYELSSGANIHGNIVYENGFGFKSWGFGAGILIQNSSNCSVHSNTLAWNADGIVVLSQDRGSAAWNNVTGNRVDNNFIAHEDNNEPWGSFAGAVLEDWDGVATKASSGNGGAGNTYYFTDWLASEPAVDNGVWILRGRNGDEGFYGVPAVFAGNVISRTEANSILASLGIPLSPGAR